MLERRSRPFLATLVPLLKKFKLRLGLTVGLLVLLLVGLIFFSSATSAAVEAGEDLVAASTQYPAQVAMDMSKPTAYFKTELTVPSGMHNTTVTVTLLSVVNHVQSVVGDPWIVELEVEEPQVLNKRFPGPDASFDSIPDKALVFELSTSSTVPLGLDFHVVQLSDVAAYQVLFAAVILVFVYVFIVFELLDRTVAAMLGSFITLATLSAVDERPALETIIGWIEYETVCLLFGMMVMVGIFASTGFFEWIAVKAYKASKGNINHLVVILCTFTGVLSAFLDNVTTILLLTPVTIQLCTVLDIDPIPILIAEAVFSNVGGTATAIGDPPAAIIVSNSDVAAAGIGFLDLTLNLAPGVFLASGMAFLFFRFHYRGLFDNVKPLTELEQELEVWRRTLKRTPVGTTPEESHVHQLLGEHIARLEEMVAEEAAEGGGAGLVSLDALDAKYKIHDIPLFISCFTILTVVICLFFLQSVFKINLNLAWISILGALTMLIVSGVHDLEEVLEKVEWATLLFFASLFILMEGLSELGLITYIGDVTSEAIKSVPESSRLAVAILIVLWVSAVVSAFLDNIPFVTAMIPVVLQLGEDPVVNLPLPPLIYALAFGACMGGTGTLVGSSANLVSAGLASQAGYQISFNRFFRTGFPVMIVCVATVSVYMMVVYVWWGL